VPLHDLLTQHPAVLFATKTEREAREAVADLIARDRAAVGEWDAQSVAAARKGQQCPPRPVPTQQSVYSGLQEDVINAQRAAKAVLADVAQEVEDELLQRQSEVLTEVAEHRDRLVLLAVELSDLGCTATHLDRARDIGMRGHLTYRPDPSELIRVGTPGKFNDTIWVAV